MSDTVSERRTASWGAPARARAVRTGLVLAGLAMLAVAVGAAARSDQTSRSHALDTALADVGGSDADALQEYFDRARSVDLLLAHNEAVLTLVEAADDDPRSADQVERGEVDEALAYLETLYPGAISEACLIDRRGHEFARVVGERAAPVSDLSTTEASAPFFAPTLRLDTDGVYQASPYLSEDTHQWVVSNSTPVHLAGGRAWGLLHFEVTLHSFLPRLRTRAGHGDVAQLVDTHTGQVLVDALGIVSTGDRIGRPAPPALRRLTASEHRFGTIGGRRYSVTPVPGGDTNANHWAVVVSSPSAAGGISGFGTTSFATVLAALLMLGFAGLSMLTRHRQLQRASETDALTGLANRRLLSLRINQALGAAARRQQHTAALLLDLDRFKEVNDTLGHHYGDDLLRSVAQRLVAACRAGDTVARLGGDEFAILLPAVPDVATVVRLADRCLAALAEPMLVRDISVSVEASVGIALAPEHGTDANSLLRAADVAMYEAKGAKAGAVVYDVKSDGNTPWRLAVLGDLRRAIQDDELVMYYQPKVELGSGAVTSVEALVRWMHPERGIVPPAEFVPVAEGSGLVMMLTMRTLELSARQARDWFDEGRRLQVAVNLSPRCLQHPGFAGAVLDVVQKHSLPPELLRLEVTESTVMWDPTRAIAVLAEIRDAGVALSIDDFGSGYSSMTALQQMPVDELKIDRSFVTHLLRNPSDETLVRSSIELAHQLGMSVVAEGVEDDATVTALRNLGCDAAQGYHLSVPMPAASVGGWLDQRALVATADTP